MVISYIWPLPNEKCYVNGIDYKVESLLPDYVANSINTKKTVFSFDLKAG